MTQSGAKGPIIESNRGAIFRGPNGDIGLEFNSNFQPRWQKSYSRAQKFVDSEILRYSEPYIPLLTGVLVKTGILGTDIGSGLIEWIAPYAKTQYYSPRAVGSQTGALRGPFWFRRMKEVSGRKIIAGAKKIAGRA